MEVRFRKSDDGRTCGWEALRPPRTRVPGPVMAAGKDVPHDLATFVIEQALPATPPLSALSRGATGPVPRWAHDRLDL